MTKIRGVVFDKDGTLVDFHRTWDRAVFAAIGQVCPTDAVQRSLADSIGYDLDSQRVVENSPFVAESAATLNQLVEPFADPHEFEAAVIDAGVESAVALDGAAEVVSTLARASIPMTVATNDTADSARRQLEKLGLAQQFAGFFGYDSGFGPKPDPGMVIAAAAHMGIPATEVAMVGDSSTDVYSGRSAGAFVVYLAPDPTTAEPALIDVADVVITKLTDLLPVVI